ncbi:MAG TPA: hypothetical protein VF545_06355 [Thermoleophilaceae bacterium]|jgi:hypothetical protein
MWRFSGVIAAALSLTLTTSAYANQTNSTSVISADGKVACGIYTNITKDAGVLGQLKKIWYSGNVHCTGITTFTVSEYGFAYLTDANERQVHTCDTAQSIEPVFPGIVSGDCTYQPTPGLASSRYEANMFVQLRLDEKPAGAWAPGDPRYCQPPSGPTIICALDGAYQAYP